jgi:hypothetical protein
MLRAEQSEVRIPLGARYSLFRNSAQPDVAPI